MKSYSSISIFVFANILVFHFTVLNAQSNSYFLGDEKSTHAKINNQNIFTKTSASNWFDVTYYRLDLNVLTPSSYLKGKVTINGICLTSNAQTLTLDLVNKMQIDSVISGGVQAVFVQHNNSFDVTLERYYSYGENISLEVFYEGLPLPTGFGSFIFALHNSIPWVYSLSQPYGAKDWWPCKDDPSDKADSADIIVTCDSTFRVGSQGILVSVNNNNDGTATHHWKERYPIASYLISIAVTNYVQFSNWFKYSDTDSMEVLNYVLPEHYSNAIATLPKTVNMLSIFSDLFGPYPFIKEKYGHAEIGSGGAMEHQTMTSTTNFIENTIAHELAHQWFGDMITCRTWADLWLNEGFAQYSTALYLERAYGINAYWEYIKSQMDQAKLAEGAIGIPDTSSVRNLFDSHRIYSKGACILHMLRHVLGDSIFFRSLHTYANDPMLKYSTATIQDFISVCENVSSKDLRYFFQQWIYGEDYPKYYYTWKWRSDGGKQVVVLDIEQESGKNNPLFFTMPIDIQIKSAQKDTTVKIFNNAQVQTFKIDYTEEPDFVLIDPEGWILKTAYFKDNIPGSEFILEQNFPNPFNASTTISYRLPKKGRIELKIFDILGREIATIVDKIQSAGYYEYSWSPSNNASGIFFYQLKAESVVIHKKMAFIR